MGFFIVFFYCVDYTLYIHNERRPNMYTILTHTNSDKITDAIIQIDSIGLTVVMTLSNYNVIYSNVKSSFPDYDNMVLAVIKKIKKGE